MIFISRTTLLGIGAGFWPTPAAENWNYSICPGFYLPCVSNICNREGLPELYMLVETSALSLGSRLVTANIVRWSNGSTLRVLLPLSLGSDGRSNLTGATLSTTLSAVTRMNHVETRSPLYTYMCYCVCLYGWSLLAFLHTLCLLQCTMDEWNPWKTQY